MGLSVKKHQLANELEIRQRGGDYFCNAVQVLGLPKSAGKIFGFLFWSEQAVGMEMISNLLGICLGSVSQGLKQLRQFGAVRVVHPVGERRARFEAVAELEPLGRGYISKYAQF